MNYSLPIPEICLSCGAEVHIHPNATSTRCRHCQTRIGISSFIREEKHVAVQIEQLNKNNTLSPQQLSEQINQLTDSFLASADGQLWELFRQGDTAQRRGDFDEAMKHYQKVLERCPNESEIHWRIMLCRYGINYIYESVSGCALPVITKTDISTIENDVHFIAAKEQAPDNIIRSYYVQEAQRINDLLSNYRKLCSQQKPYDVFICFDRESPDTDHKAVRQLYDLLTQHNLKVFYSAINLPNYSVVEREPYIMHALSTAKVMIAAASRSEHLHSPWVKSEWQRFRDLMDNKNTSRQLIAYIIGNEKWDIQELNTLHIVHGSDDPMSAKKFCKDIAENIPKSKPKTLPLLIAGGAIVAAAGIFALSTLFGSSEPTPTPPVLTVTQTNATSTATPLLISSSTLEPVVISDGHLNRALLNALGKKSDTVLTLGDLQQITSLALNFQEIKDITALRHCTNLQELDLSFNCITDLSPLASLPQLTTLNLQENEISDLSPLANLSQLTTLTLFNNQIADLSPLANLMSLQQLELDGNRISDLTALSNLTNLKKLDLRRNEITDISPLKRLTNLEFLALSDNNIHDISELSDLKNLRELLLHNNQIADFFALTDLERLKHLTIYDNASSAIGYDIIFYLKNIGCQVDDHGINYSDTDEPQIDFSDN